jgi:hypothetical protein
MYKSYFADRRKKINEICKNLQGKEDRTLLKSIFSIANYENKFGADAETRIGSTMFTGQSDKDLMENFLKSKFTGMGEKQLTNLFQELYNRATVKNGNDPRYVVSVKNIEDGIMGFMETYSNSLEINKSMINRFKNNQGSNVRGNNVTTVGPMFANVLLHETQHTCQMENICKYACGEIVDKEEKARACMSLMKVVVEEIAYDREDQGLTNYLEKNYWYDFDEHDANMAPMLYIKDMYEKGDIKDRIYAEVMHSWEEDSLGFKVDWDNKSKANKNFETRLRDMENVANYCINVFDKNVQDGEMKRDIMNTLNEYMKVDENGDSPFRNRIRDDFNMCAQVFFNKDKYMGKQKKSEQTQTY